MYKVYVKIDEQLHELDHLIENKAIESVKNVSLIEAIEFYLKNYTIKKSIKSQKNEKKYFQILLNFSNELKKQNLIQISKNDLLKLQKELLKKNKAATVNRHFNTYKNFFKVCKENNYINSFPSEGISHAKVIKPKIQLWSDLDIKNVSENIKSPLKDIFSFIALTGARPIEATDLVWSDIDDDNMIITFRSKKNSNEYRCFPLSNKVKLILDSLPKKSEFVFLDEKNNKYTTDKLYKRVKRIIRESCKNQDLHLYGLRHTFASNLLKRNVSAPNIQQLMGHSDFRTTQNYLHINVMDLKKYVD